MFRRESLSWLPLTRVTPHKMGRCHEVTEGTAQSELLSISETEGEKHYVSNIAFLSLRLLLRKIHLPHQREARFISRSKSNRIPCRTRFRLFAVRLRPPCHYERNEVESKRFCAAEGVISGRTALRMTFEGMCGRLPRRQVASQ